MKIFYVLGAALFLASCGGGSGGGGAPEAPSSSGLTTQFFGADNGANGSQLWKTNGTAAGTAMVKVINPGGDASITVAGRLGDKTIFVADDGIHGLEPWVTDGTEAGTNLLKDINAGTGDSQIDRAAIAANTLYFGAYDVVNGAELWKTDGTSAGTVLVKDIFPGADSFQIKDMMAVGATVFFSANDGSADYELWKTDGTAAGTVMVADISPSASSNPSRMASLDGVLYFSASDGSSGFELWKSDGTAAGTVQVKDIAPGADSSSPTKLVVMGGNVYFVAAESVAQGYELWRTDGTAAGTVLVKDINANVHSSINNSSSAISYLTVVGDKLYFRARTGPAEVNGLWVSDGSEAGTLPLFDAHHVASLVATSEKLFFRGTDAMNGAELWATDGTVVGTALVKNIEPGAQGSDFFGLGEYYIKYSEELPIVEVSPGVALIVAVRSDIGGELWKSDGTEAGTRLIMDINPGMASSFY